MKRKPKQECENPHCNEIFKQNPIKKYCKRCSWVSETSYKKGYITGYNRKNEKHK